METQAINESAFIDMALVLNQRGIAWESVGGLKFRLRSSRSLLGAFETLTNTFPEYIWIGQRIPHQGKYLYFIEAK